MSGFGRWTTYTALRQRAVTPPGWFEALYGNPTGAASVGQSWTATLAQSYDAYVSGQLPHTHLDARLCAQFHARDLDTRLGIWDPGVCPAIGSPTLGNALSIGATIPVGTVTSWSPGFFLVAATYSCTLIQGQGALTYSSAAAPNDAPASVLYQVPGFADAVVAGPEPEVEVLQVDGEVTLGCSVPQAALTNGMTVSAHGGATFGTGTPYYGIGSAQMSVPAIVGTTSSPVTVPDMHPGDASTWSLASSRVMASIDPGPAESNVALIDWNWDFLYTIRVRMPIPDVVNVCRWRQRDDGLGVSGAARARTGTSLQSTSRFRGYR